MRKILLTMMVLGVIYSGGCWADGYEFNLTASGTSFSSGIHYKKSLNTGYMKTGVGLIYTDDDDTEYQWVDLSFMVGSETLAPGLTCEVGLGAIFGDVEEDRLSSDLGALAFSGRLAYQFPRRVMPIPLELFSTLSYAPEILSFRDTKSYTAYSLGAGLQVVPNATIFFEYANYDIESEDASIDWDLEDDVVRLGLRIRF